MISDSYIKFDVTGNLRSVANAAWISTMNQSKAEERSDEDVERVTKFLAENAHTSPFESVTVTTLLSEDIMQKYRSAIGSSHLINFFKFGKVNYKQKESSIMTSDLLNFYKINFHVGLENIVWSEFSKEFPDLANTVSLIPLS